MGLIDKQKTIKAIEQKAKRIKNLDTINGLCGAVAILFEQPTVEAIPKDQYETRLKADLVAMLYELKSEIDNMPKYYRYTDHTRSYIDGDVLGLIQEKINALKEQTDEQGNM